MARKSDTKRTGGDRDYEVGRGKPPLHTRYKTGQSGNPSGKRKGLINLRAIYLELLATEVTVSINGRTESVPFLKAIALREFQEASSGNGRAIRDVLDRAERYGEPNAPPTTELREEDEAILRRVIGAPEHATDPGNPAPDGEEPSDG